NVTMFMVLHAAWAATLTRLGCGTDIPIGTPIAGRTDEALDDLVGFFVNTLVLRTDTSGDPSFAELLDRVRETDLAAYAHQDLPFERLVEHLNPARSAARHPLFQTMLALEDTAAADWTLPDLVGVPEPVDMEIAKFDLTLNVTETHSSLGAPAGLESVCVYKADIFAPRVIDLLMQRLARLLTAVAEDPDQSLSGLEIFTDAEAAALAAGDRDAVHGLVRAQNPLSKGSGHLAIRSPRTPQEEVLCGLFAQVLGVESVAMDDNFFALGGHSLLGTRLISRIRTVLGVNIGIRSLFRSPTVAGLAQQLEKVQGALSPLTARSRPARLPLSFAQQRLWFLEAADDSVLYNAPFAWTLTGAVDVEALREALADVVARHESLRTDYPSVDGRPHQRILPVELSRPEIRLHACEGADFSVAAEKEARAPFDLECELPIRVSLFVVGPQESVLMLVLHHIASDGWSMGPLMRDLSVAYEARCAGRAPEWGVLRVQYVDYALWQRELLGEVDDPDSLLSRQLAYWEETLAGMPEELALPTDRPRPAVSAFTGDTVSFHLGSDMHRRLTLLARSHNVTMFMVLHAAWAATLTRLGCGTDIPIGTPIAGRTDEALDDLVGFFVNTLVLRTDTSGDPSFAELLDRVRETDLAAYAHQDLPFERLVEHLNPARSAARHPLFQTMLALQTHEEPELNLPGLRTDLVEIASGIAKFDLMLTLNEQVATVGAPDGIFGVMEYATDLFDKATVEQLSRRFSAVLEAVTAEPHKAIGSHDILTPDEARQILVDWNATAQRLPAETLPEAFRAQVARTPDATAVIYEGTRLSYTELDERASRLSRLLIEQGVGPGKVVALALSRSLDLITAIYAVVSAGAAYLPLDPDYPEDRLGHMLEDARPVCLLTVAAHSGRLPHGTTQLVLGHPDTRRALADPRTDRAGREEPVRTPAPTDPAYVIYTSGSTGRPKGVVVSHGAIMNRLRWMQSSYRLEADDRVLQKTPSSFDVSVWEFFWPLIEGATMVVARPEGHKDPAYLARVIQEQSITTVHFVPSMLSAFLADPAAAECTRLRRLLCSGEALPEETAIRCHSLLPNTELHNLYGPTETAVDVTSWRCDPDATAGPVPIGRPVWNTCLYVLDPALRPVPAGVVGELYVAGAQLAEGYLGRPGLTAQQFVASPFDAPGERMYRTGDLVRRRADGVLEYVGRVDDQVKIRGSRVEPAEIEAVLAQHDSVRQVAVVARDDQRGDKRLVAHVVVEEGQEFDAGQLRGLVSDALPQYMVPAAFLATGALPMTPSGKLNRSALPAPQFAVDRDGRGPRTARERFLCSLFAEVLGLESVGIDDDFFNLGGHSLLAARLVSRLRTTLRPDVGMRLLFQAPTVAELSERLNSSSQGEVFPTLLPLRSVGSAPPLFCVHPAAGISWVYSGLLQHLVPHQPVYGLQARTLRTFDEASPTSAVEMVREYIDEIRSVQPTGPYHLLGWSFGGLVAHDIAARLQADGQEVASLTLLDAYPDDSGEVPALKYDDPELLAMVVASLGDSGTAGLVSDFGDVGIRAIARTFADNVNTQHTLPTRVFGGDMLLFVASATGREEFSTPDLWKPFVSGRINVHEIDATHGAMTGQAALATIGPLLSEWLGNASAQDGADH
ncbi:amino acid adenylation domain-containing protein, partial [Streptomyces sp. NPDC056708]|uniref:non-ribosomal peptide synthetase n=4 Tax=unclassified Streptomyces TaxID=2593676 RepID=UPI0036C17F29